MADTFINAAPMSNLLGVDDDSERQVPTAPVVVAQHIPKLYIYAKDGPTTPQLVSGQSLLNMYNSDSFDMHKPYANHATKLLNIFDAAASTMMVERVKPLDAGPNATIRLYADVLPVMVQDYQRNDDGSYKTDSSGNNLPTSNKVQGFTVKFVQDVVTLTDDGTSTFGQATQKAGDQTDTSVTPAVQSVRYPIMDQQVSFFGANGNNKATRLWAPTVNSSTPVSQTLLQDTRSYPFQMACLSRTNNKTTGTIVTSLENDQSITISFKPGAYDDNAGASIYVSDNFLDAYQDLATVPPTFGTFGDIAIYDANIANLVTQFYDAEFLVKDEFTDFTGEDDEAYKFNFIGGTSSSAVPYHSYQVISGTGDSVRLSENSTLYATGGTDGTMNDALFASLVETAVAGYTDPNSIYQNTAKYVESALWDSGFPMSTKKILCNFIGMRKDTHVVLSTAIAGEAAQSASTDSSRSVLLKTYAQMYPESEFFGTKTMRATIVSRSGILVDKSYGTKRLPLTLDLAQKVANYMGAGNGVWTNGQSFDSPPNNQVTMFRDVSVTFTPASVRNQDWGNGMNWVESFDTQSLYYPAVRTVYENDTSILTGFMTMCACVEVEKVADRARRQFSGNQTLTNSQYASRVNKFISDNTVNRFDGKYTIQPDTYFTDADVARGYSYTCEIDLFGPNMKTVGTFSIVARRQSDLTTSTS